METKWRYNMRKLIVGFHIIIIILQITSEFVFASWWSKLNNEIFVIKKSGNYKFPVFSLQWF